MPMPTVVDGGIMFRSRLSSHPFCVHALYVITSLEWFNVSVHSGGILMELGTNVHHVSGHC